MRLFLLTALTMTAFAANSVFARLALGDGAMDPASYTLIRILAGALMLVLLVGLGARGRSRIRSAGSLVSALALFGYAAGFSYAYVALETGIGALILFACVQATMIGWAVARGDRPLPLEWLGLIAAFAAFVWLVSPGLAAPDPLGAALMAGAGIAWGIYSLRGRGVGDPLAGTAGAFVLAAPLGVGLALIGLAGLAASPFGVLMAVASGALASGLGYALWYRVLGSLTATQAGIVQLTVPVIAVLGGIAFLGEPLTLRFALASTVILGGVAVAIVARGKRGPAPSAVIRSDQ
jgi:drug/metabolite transporter (DMT)-like permease